MFELFIQRAQEVLSVPAILINSIPILPEYIKDALITSINFVPWLYFLYYGIELLERFFLKNIGFFIYLIKRFGAIFGTIISTIPECGYSVIASIYYSRKMITRGTLLAFLIACSDDALPLLFMDLSKALYVIPIIIIKIVVGIIVAYTVDLLFIFNHDRIEDSNAVNTDLNNPGCCHHNITTNPNPPYWWMHPFNHTFNTFMFTFFTLVFLNCAINWFGSAEDLSTFLLIDSPYQVIAGAIFGLIPNSVTSIFLALAFVKGLISFPTLLAGLITTTGLALITLAKHKPHSKDNGFITTILLLVGIGTGLFIHFNLQIVSAIQNYFAR